MYSAHNPAVKAAVAWYGPVARSYFPGDKPALDGREHQGPVLGPVRRGRRGHPARR